MFAQLLEFAPDAIVGSGSDGRIVLANHRAGELFGYPRSELIGQPVELLVPDWFGSPDADPRDGYIPDTTSTPAGTGVELVGVRKDASEFPAEISVSSIETENGIVATAAVRDVSDRADTERERALAEELNQARRLESVGQLAGGIAHDFNNLLGIIINYAKFAADALPEDGQTREDVEEIRTAAKRAAELTRQLLIFSRREVVKSEVLDLNDVVAELGNLLHRALGERITLETRFGDELWPVEADPGQLEQVLVNLAVNARDAMPEGGRLIVETTNTVARRGLRRRPRQRASGPLCPADGQRLRRRHGRGGPAARVRAVLHDEAQGRRAPASGSRRSMASSRRRAVGSTSTPSAASGRR